MSHSLLDKLDTLEERLKTLEVTSVKERLRLSSDHRRTVVSGPIIRHGTDDTSHWRVQQTQTGPPREASTFDSVDLPRPTLNEVEEPLQSTMNGFLDTQSQDFVISDFLDLDFDDIFGYGAG